MPITIQPPPGRVYASAAEARAAWERGEQFIVNDKYHPAHGSPVTRDKLSEPVTVLPRAVASI